jgi:hypothetical protein
VEDDPSRIAVSTAIRSSAAAAAVAARRAGSEDFVRDGYAGTPHRESRWIRHVRPGCGSIAV